MVLSELLRRFRVDANDKVEPYFNEDIDVIAWLNDAVNEACIRSRLLHESQSPDVCKIAVTASSSQYQLHPSLYELTQVWFEPDNGFRGSSLSLVSPEYLDQRYGPENWRRLNGMPQFAIQDDTTIRLVPTPDVSGELQLEGYRVPFSPMQNDTDIPEINQIHHVHLINWALYRAFSVPDSEFFDPNRAAIAEQAFTDYFGPRPDSDLRRMTREDVPHVVQPFFP
ncbi:hypothetical protein [Acinetobacter sp. CIP 102129]|uniref:phage adaptor protein n=1 Tax=Acinetobacter sp. CIP 102129 TaxID=1144664 RepID=UPI0002D10D07|nr:hypothetical protein [Acinetobacter sp. CIP 102129]ENU86131.1 hypothetical protein F973_01728 [Acinetobacter sp. CIP 102129]